MWTENCLIWRPRKSPFILMVVVVLGTLSKKWRWPTIFTADLKKTENLQKSLTEEISETCLNTVYRFRFGRFLYQWTSGYVRCRIWLQSGFEMKKRVTFTQPYPRPFGRCFKWYQSNILKLLLFSFVLSLYLKNKCYTKNPYSQQNKSIRFIISKYYKKVESKTFPLKYI